jgi:hypothetical protein
MKKFIKNLIIFAFPIVVLAIFIEVYLRNIPNDYSYKSKYLDANSKNIQVLFLGSSHSFFGINPEYIQLNGFNASHTSQSLDYDLEILKKYADRWDNLKYIIIPIDYFSLYSRLESGIESWRVKNYCVYYGLYSSYKVYDYTEILSNKLQDNEKRINDFYNNNKSDITCTKLGFGTSYNSKKNNNIIETGRAAALRHKSKNDKYFTENKKVLVRMIEFCKKRNIKIIFYTSPAYKSYSLNLDSTQLNRTINTTLTLATLYPNVIYYNLLNDKSFVITDFYDGDHLNEIGAKKLTLKFDSIIHSLNN